MVRASLPRKCKAGPGSSSGPTVNPRAADKGKRSGRGRGHALAPKKTKQAVKKPKSGMHTARGSSSATDTTATMPPLPAAPVSAVPVVAREESPDTVSSEKNPWVLRRPQGTGVVHYGSISSGYDVLSGWKRLYSPIGYLTENFFPKKMSWDTLDAETREKMLSWAPNAKYALENDQLSCCKQSPVPTPRFFLALLCSAR